MCLIFMAFAIFNCWLQSFLPLRQVSSVTLNNIKPDVNYLLRFDDQDKLFYLYDSDANKILCVSEQGNLLRMLVLDSLKIKTFAPVKKSVRITDLWPSKGRRLWLAEQNTACLYLVDSSLTIERKIQLQNSPKGVLELKQDTLVVIDSDFSYNRFNLMSLSQSEAKVVQSIDFDKSMGNIFDIAIDKINYFVDSNDRIYIYASVKGAILRCKYMDGKFAIESEIALNINNNEILLMGIIPSSQTVWICKRPALRWRSFAGIMSGEIFQRL